MSTFAGFINIFIAQFFQKNLGRLTPINARAEINIKNKNTLKNTANIYIFQASRQL